jgi:type II restriction/modification system DNA methylase subunit YeeA
LIQRLQRRFRHVSILVASGIVLYLFNAMTPAEFKRKWNRFSGKESSAYQEHFNDLCRLLGQPTPVEADPSGTESFCFQKRVIKDAELFELHETPDVSEPAERGFADVWKKGCFAWEYKGKKKNLDEAYKQLLRYRESLLNPPLLVVCDFDRYIVKTNFNGTVQEMHEFTNDQIDRPENLRILHALFENPDYLKPQRTTAQITKNLAAQIAEIARSLQSRESVELADAKSRAEVNVAQKKNLRIARFLNRIVFCFFAEDTGLLPKNLFTEIAKVGIDDPKLFAETLEKLFAVMAKGGTFGKDKIRYFNGHLFEEASVFELTETELRQLADAGEADWQFIEPSIMGTLFERALDESQRSQLGAHYTSEADIKTLVEPVLMQPFRREWAQIKGELAAAYAKGKGNAAQRERLAKFQKQLAAVTVLDPACGSGNFLYVSLQLLLGLEKEVITFATQLGFAFKPQVTVPQLKAIEINPYAFELAQVSVQIGYLQWRRDNGFDNDRSPVLQNLDGFQNEDALLVPHFRSKAKTLKEAQAGEHKGDDALKFYTERDWPEADVIVGNPPFLGGSKLWEELGRHYQKELWKIYEGRVPGSADLCCYWFEKARQQIENGKCKRAGLLATQGIRGGANREVLNRIGETGDIFFAESSRDWILAGAAVNVSMIGFDDGSQREKTLDGKQVKEIKPNLGSEIDLGTAKNLPVMEGLAFIGTKKAGKFELDDKTARELLSLPNPHGLPNSDVIRPWLDGFAIVKRPAFEWIIDCGLDMAENTFAGYESPYARALELVKPDRDKNNRKLYRDKWWLHAETRPGMRKNCLSLPRYLATVCHSKHRLFVWANSISLPDGGVFTFARSDDFFFGVLHSRLHEVWALKQGTHLEDRPRYTPTTCFETFPFPFADDLAEQPDNTEAMLNAAKHYAHITLREEPPPRTPDEHRTAIADAAKELNELRERWLNPPEWTRTEYLEFPASVDGPWSRYVDSKTVHEVGRVTPCAPGRTAEDCHPYLVGLARYPRLVPKDADCAVKLKERTLTKLYNERPAWLDLAHKKLDAAVAAAYGFPADLTDEQILEKLLALNLERAAEEVKAAKVKKPKTSREKSGDEMI